MQSQTTYYYDLSEAITQAQKSENSGCTVTLLNDVEITATVNIASGKFTIDLNGKTWSNTGTGSAFYIIDGDVTLKDSVTGGKITTTNGHCVWVDNTNGANPVLTITGGTYEPTKDRKSVV